MAMPPSCAACPANNCVTAPVALEGVVFVVVKVIACVSLLPAAADCKLVTDISTLIGSGRIVSMVNILTSSRPVSASVTVVTVTSAAATWAETSIPVTEVPINVPINSIT